MSAIEDEATKWRINLRTRTIGSSRSLPEPQAAVRCRTNDRPQPTRPFLGAVNKITKQRATPSDNVLPMDVAVKFGTNVLPHSMKVAKLIDAKIFVVKVNEPRYNINRMAAKVRMQSCSAAGAAAIDDAIDEAAAAASDDNEIFVEPAQKNIIGRISAKVELQNGINGDGVFNTDIEVVNTMSVKTLRENVKNVVFGDYGPIHFEMVLKTGSVLMYDNVAGGDVNIQENFDLNRNNVIQVRNLIRLMKDKKAMHGDSAKQQNKMFARFCLNPHIDEDSTATLRGSQYVIRSDQCWTKTSDITFRFIEHPESSDYRNRCITLYDKYS